MKLFLAAVVMMMSMGSSYAGDIKAQVELFPAGDFTAKSDQVTGHLVKKEGKLLLGTPIKVPVSSFKTGIELRDKHMQEYMSSKGKHPNITISRGIAKDGKGMVMIEMNGKSKQVDFSYEEKPKQIAAKFKIKISDYGIDGINYRGIGVDDEVEVEANIDKK